MEEWTGPRLGADGSRSSRSAVVPALVRELLFDGDGVRFGERAIFFREVVSSFDAFRFPEER